MELLSELPNLGPVTIQRLKQVGIETPEQLRAVGAEEAWLRIRTQVDSGACLHELSGLAGAVLGIRKTTLPPERRAELKAFFDRMK